MTDFAIPTRPATDGAVSRAVATVKAVFGEVRRSFAEVSRMRREAAERYPFIQE
ncbi:hypothetical protein [Rhodoplanes elegans]|uniref:hypothetical protein n=1 Tax=Rhodoplanes elegans TaxID=29408 RepID=UPI00147570B4|nr:hypothetical protein [Rhodoplanes elegans]